MTGRQRLSILRIVLIQAFFLMLPFIGLSQDLRLFSVASPSDGCMLANNENVSIVIINVGPQLLGASFNATYILNNGTPVTEIITLPPVFNNGSLISYTFSTTADLSIPGTYQIDTFIDLTNDTDRSNDTISDFEVISYPFTVGGNLSGSTILCSGSNTGQLNLSGQTGSILNWESSINGMTWTPISNTTTVQNYLNLTSTTYYRAVIKSGLCPQLYSSIDTIKVDPVSVGGTISGGMAVCPGASGTLTLSGQTGTILNWEISTDNGATWNPISNTTTTQSYTGIIVPTLYRAHIKSGVCSDTYSSNASITILPATAGGSTSGTDTMCSGSNSGTITLSGHTGNILRWEYSTNGGSTWQNISNTTTSINYTNLTVTTQYRAVVQSCAPAANSTIATITVNPVPVAGTLTGAATVCASSNSGMVTLTGSQGSISWESSSDGITWNPVAGSSSILSYSNLTSTLKYRAKVGSTPCIPVYSNVITITVDPATDAGLITGSTTVCITSNSGSLQLTQYAGSISGWQKSTNGGTSWTSITNTTDIQNYLNLTTTTSYRAIVKSGVCPSDTSTTGQITVISATNAGYISGEDSICNSTSGNIQLNAFAGNLTWQVSYGDSLTWQNLADTTSSITTPILTGITYFRAIAGTAACASDTSNAFLISIVSINAQTSSDTTIGSGTQITLHASGGLSYSWQPSGLFTDPLIADAVASPIETTTFTVEVTGPKGCKDTGNVVVTVNDDTRLFIPNLISPNGDGINDTWVIEGIKNLESEVSIFSSSGKTIFTANPYTNNWDGQLNGSVLSDGTYYFLLILTDSGGNKTTHKGNINLKTR